VIVDWSVTKGDAALSSDRSITDQSGTASVRVSRVRRAGSNTVTATLFEIGKTVNITFTASVWRILGIVFAGLGTLTAIILLTALIAKCIRRRQESVAAQQLSEILPEEEELFITKDIRDPRESDYD